MNVDVTDERAVLKPFDDIDTAIKMLAEVTGLELEEVVTRLRREHQGLGRNVADELDDWGIGPFQWSDRLVEFYGHSQAFLFESFVWNSTSRKQSLRRWILRHLERESAKSLQVLLYGDGLGFDSAYLARHGCAATYFEIGQPCVRFANEVFRLNDVNVEMVADANDLPAAAYDAVLCLDVLEHVPDPPELVQKLATYLRPGGKLIAHAPFWYIHRDVKTHLRSNVRYSGGWQRLYKQAGLRPVDAAMLWCPLVLVKDSSATPQSIAARFRLTANAALLASARISTLPLVSIFKIFFPLKPGFEMDYPAGPERSTSSGV